MRDVGKEHANPDIVGYTASVDFSNIAHVRLLCVGEGEGLRAEKCDGEECECDDV